MGTGLGLWFEVIGDGLGFHPTEHECRCVPLVITSRGPSGSCCSGLRSRALVSANGVTSGALCVSCGDWQMQAVLPCRSRVMKLLTESPPTASRHVWMLDTHGDHAFIPRSP